MRLEQSLGNLAPLVAGEVAVLAGMPDCLAMASSNPVLRSVAAEAPVVPSSSMILALPFVALMSQSAERRPSSMKSEPMKVR